MARNEAPVLYAPDGRPIDRSDYSLPWDFGAGVPLLSTDGTHVPYDYQYPFAFNANWSVRTDDGSPSFDALRRIAKANDYFQIALTTCCNQIANRRLDFRARDRANSRAAQSEVQADRQRANEFWRRPCRSRRMTFRRWLYQIWREIFTTDGMRLFRETDETGTLVSLRQIEPSLLKPVIDGLGGIVQWQFIARGIARATYDARLIIDDAYAPTIEGLYGYSHVEMVLRTLDISTLKLLVEKAYFSDSDLPAGWVVGPADWTADNVEKWQQNTQRLFSSPTRRHRVRMLPSGGNWIPIRPNLFDSAHEDALISRICAVFSLPRSIFVDTQNRSASEVADDFNYDAGVASREKFILDVIDEVTSGGREDYGLGIPNLEPYFINDSPRAIEQDRKNRHTNISIGVTTPDEERAALGYDPMSDEQKQEVAKRKEGDDAPDPEGKTSSKFAQAKKKARKRLSHKTESDFVAKLQDAAKRYIVAVGEREAEKAKNAFANADTSEGFADEIAEIMKSIYALSAEDAAALVDEMIGSGEIDLDYVEASSVKYAKARAAELVKGIADSTRDSINSLVTRGLEEGWSYAELRKAIVDDWGTSDYRANMIARTEFAFAKNNGALDTYGKLGIDKVLVIDGDDWDDACASANGQTWTIEEALADPIAHPNCTRDFAPQIEMEGQE